MPRRLGGLAVAAALLILPVSAEAAEPVCVDTDYTVGSGQSLDLQGACTDGDGDTLSYSVVNWPLHGSLTGTSSGSATYTSYVGFTGSDSFTYRAQDTQGNFSNVATVSIEVTAGPASSPPQCPDLDVFVPIYPGSVILTGRCADPDGQPVGYSLSPPNPTLGSLSIVAGNQVQYAPFQTTLAGAVDSFGYTASAGTDSVARIAYLRMFDPAVTDSFASSPDTTSDEPLRALVESPNDGPVTIGQRSVTTAPPDGFFLLGQEWVVEAPDASVEVPLRLTFEVDADAIPALPLSVFRDGLEVGNCTSTGAAADPDPCLERPFLTDGDGDLLITVRSSHASLWQLGVPEAFPFRGFFAPVNNFSVTNLASAGRAIPIKFSLDGDRGLDIFEPGYPKSQAVDCDSSAKIDGIESAASASSLPLTYDKTTGQYTYVWKTAREWAGSCRELVVKLVDGSSHPATFRFK